jgi:hypothetical protein
MNTLRVLRKIFGCKRAEVAVDWRKCNNKELQNKYGMGLQERLTTFCFENMKGRDHSEYIYVDCRRLVCRKYPP